MDVGGGGVIHISMWLVGAGGDFNFGLPAGGGGIHAEIVN